MLLDYFFETKGGDYWDLSCYTIMLLRLTGQLFLKKEGEIFKDYIVTKLIFDINWYFDYLKQRRGEL